jgi:hypothetical protein
MDRKSLEKMVEKIMSKLKEDSEEDPDSDFVHDGKFFIFVIVNFYALLCYKQKT